MTRYDRTILALVLGAIVFTPAFGAGPPVRNRARVELRWLESRRIDGVTEAKSIQGSCDPKDVLYPHKKPALVLTGAHVTRAVLTRHDFSRSGAGSDLYMVALHLNKEARDKLAASCEGNQMRLLTVVVDGRFWGVHRYEKDKDKPFVPEQARAETFQPGVGFFSSLAEAQRLADAFN